MNQDQVKEKLLTLESECADFILLFSGKTSTRVNGLYKPDAHEILLHNQNFDNDNSLMYTAIHEFAHHIQFTRYPGKLMSRSHSTVFWNIFHTLLVKAENMGIYNSVFNTDAELIEMTQRIKSRYLSQNAHLMLEFGSVLIEAQELCQKKQVNFHDYMDRALGLHRNTAKNIIKISEMDIPPEIGYENIKSVAAIRDPAERKQAVDAFTEGYSPDMVKGLRSMPPAQSQLDVLIEEKNKIEKSLDALTTRLVKIERKIQELQ